MIASVISYIGFGSNMGDRRTYCEEAVRLVSQFPKTSVVSVSSLYETEPLERTDQEWFINCVGAVRTELGPMELFGACQEVERFLGRKRTARYGPRTIDLDILFYGDRVIQDPPLNIPHPKVHERRFAMEPLVEIAPNFVHPVLIQTAVQILNAIRGQETRRLDTLGSRSEDEA